ncbi:hypothetical protein COO60DRAFT_1460856 [Scenedesmus sp. NREL 46B-D3]|nr:hypothetical protein COO60DRAFT_1460856 [Scenedesmus sp. NREL 46B-D3]
MGSHLALQLPGQAEHNAVSGQQPRHGSVCAMAQPQLQPKVSAAAPAQPASCGRSNDVMKELQCALKHRHSMLKTYKHLTDCLWEQLQLVLKTSSQAVHQATTNLHLLLDIDHTLVSSSCLSEAFDATSGTRSFEDPDLQKFYNLAEQFWLWTDDALDAHNQGKPCRRGCRLQRLRAAPPRATPEFIAPVWDLDGTLTHYVCMYGRWDEAAATTPGGKPSMACMQVFMQHAAFKHGGTYASCQGVKSLTPFTSLRHTGPGCICPRLVLDDHLMMWGLDADKDAVLKLVAKELKDAEAELPPIAPPALPVHLLPRTLADPQCTDSSLSGNSTCSIGTVSCGPSAGSPLHGSPKTKKVVIRRKGLSPRWRLGLGKQAPWGKRRHSSNGDEGSDSDGLGAAFDAVA